MNWDDIRKLTPEEFEYASQRYRPLSEAPDDAEDCTIAMPMYGVIFHQNDEEEKKKFSLLIEEMTSGKIYCFPNGSFHEYDYNIERVFPAKKWNPRSPRPESGFFEDGSWYGDTDVYYLPDDALYLIYEKNAFGWAMPIEIHTSSREYDSQYLLSSTEELNALVKKEAPRAINAWKLSKENYDG